MKKVAAIVWLEPKDKKELQTRAKKAKQSLSEVMRDILRGFINNV